MGVIERRFGHGNGSLTLQGLFGERILTRQPALFRRKVDRLLHNKRDENLRRYLGLVVLVCLIDYLGFEGARQAIAR